MQTMKVFMTGDIDNDMWLNYCKDRYYVSNDCYITYLVGEEIEWDEEIDSPKLDAEGNEIYILTEIDKMLIEAGAVAGEEVIVEHMW